MYPVKIAALVVMSNHIHLLLVIIDPRHITGFKEYLKRELAHAVNDLLGRNKHTVWCEGCDDPPILDAAKAIERLVYLYTNPQKADLEQCIELYPHLNSWEAFINGGSIETVKRIPRPSVPELPRKTIGFAEQQKMKEDLEEAGHEDFILQIEPDAWIDCFPELADSDPELLRDQIIAEVRRTENHYDRTRKRPVIGAHALKLQNIRAPHTPKKHGKKMICLGSSPAIRARYIEWRKERQQQAKDRYYRWCCGELSIELPSGMYWPGGRLATPLELPISQFAADF